MLFIYTHIHICVEAVIGVSSHHQPSAAPTYAPSHEPSAAPTNAPVIVSGMILQCSSL